MRKVLFLDRGGTLIEPPIVDRPADTAEQVRLMPGVIPALLKIKAAGYELVVVTNQARARQRRAIRVPSTTASIDTWPRCSRRKASSSRRASSARTGRRIAARAASPGSGSCATS